MAALLFSDLFRLHRLPQKPSHAKAQRRRAGSHGQCIPDRGFFVTDMRQTTTKNNTGWAIRNGKAHGQKGTDRGYHSALLPGFFVFLAALAALRLGVKGFCSSADYSPPTNAPHFTAHGYDFCC